MQPNIAQTYTPTDYSAEQRRIAELLRQSQQEEALSQQPLGAPTGTFSSGPFNFAYRNTTALDPLARGLRGYNARAAREEALRAEKELGTKMQGEAKTYFDQLQPRAGVAPSTENIVDELANNGEGANATINAPGVAGESPKEYNRRLYLEAMRGSASSNPYVKGIAAPMLAQLLKQMEPFSLKEGERRFGSPVPGEQPTMIAEGAKKPDEVVWLDVGSQKIPTWKRTGQRLTDVEAVQMGIKPIDMARFNFDVWQHNNPSAQQAAGLNLQAAGLNQTAARAADENISLPGAPRLPGFAPANPGNFLPPGAMTTGQNPAGAPQPAAPAQPMPAPASAPTAAPPVAAAPPPSVNPPGAGAKAAGPAPVPGLSPKQTREVAGERYKAFPQAQQAVKGYVDTVERLQGGVARILQAPSLAGITDLNARIFDLPGGVAASLRSELQNIKEVTSTVGLGEVRRAAGQSVGTITEREWPRFEQYFGNLDPNTTVGEFKARLARYNEALERAKQRTTEAFDMEYGDAAKMYAGGGAGRRATDRFSLDRRGASEDRRTTPADISGFKLAR